MSSARNLRTASVVLTWFRVEIREGYAFSAPSETGERQHCADAGARGGDPHRRRRNLASAVSGSGLGQDASGFHTNAHRLAAGRFVVLGLINAHNAIVSH